jgi:hypothetical protein
MRLRLRRYILHPDAYVASTRSTECSWIECLKVPARYNCRRARTRRVYVDALERQG